MSASLTDRMRGAAMLDVATYEAVEADRGATGQALVVVIIVAICQGIGGMNRGSSGIILGVIGALAGWLLWSGVTMLVGTKFFGGTADWGELLRTLGFAQTPGVLALFGLIPFLGVPILFVVGVWQLVAGVVAIRQALDFSTGKAILTALIAFVVVLVVMSILAAMFGVTAAVGRTIF